MNQFVQDKSENQLGQQYRNNKPNNDLQFHVKFMVEDIILLLIVGVGLLLVPIEEIS